MTRLFISSKMTSQQMNLITPAMVQDAFRRVGEHNDAILHGAVEKLILFTEAIVLRIVDEAIDAKVRDESLIGSQMLTWYHIEAGVNSVILWHQVDVIFEMGDDRRRGHDNLIQPAPDTLTFIRDLYKGPLAEDTADYLVGVCECIILTLLEKADRSTNGLFISKQDVGDAITEYLTDYEPDVSVH